MKALNLLLFAFLVFASTEVFAQKQKKVKEHRVVFHLATPDTVAYRALSKQLIIYYQFGQLPKLR